MSIFSDALELITGAPRRAKRPLAQLTERQLIELEDEIGKTLFGPIPDGHSRDFFCLDEKTWVWHETWIDPASGKKAMSTTRYEVHPNGILKAQNGKVYKYIEGQELTNLAVSVRLYYERVMREIYKRDPISGQPLTETPPATIEDK